MDLAETVEPAPTLHFAAVQITRPVTAASLRTSSRANDSPINQTPKTTKVAKLVFTPKPVQTKAKIAHKDNQQSQRENFSAALPAQVSLLPLQPRAPLNEIIADKTRDRSQQPREDIELERRSAARAKEKEKEEKKTLSAQAPVQSPAANKSKMDEAARCEARKFMRKQREKRKMEVKKEVDKTSVIKQRLEELRRNTKSAIAGRAKKSPGKSLPPPPPPPMDLTYYSMDNNRMKEIKVLKLKPSAPRLAQEEEKAKNAEVKEVETLQPVQNAPLHQQNHQQPASKPVTKTQLENSKENKKPAFEDLQLKVPDVKLSMTQNAPNLGKIEHSQPLPFWMQNTGIQPYPYNFIWAVRKKLEAFTTQYEQTRLQAKFDAKTPQIKRDRRQRRGRKIADDDFESEHDVPSEANTISEISSIQSDFMAAKSSSDKQPVNQISEDLKFAEKNRESVNSASFGQNSLTNVSPNTSEKRKNFLSSTTKKAEKAKEEEEDVEFKRPPAPSKAGDRLNDLNANNNNQQQSEEKEEEFRKMLLAFNKSLSHVVEVNHLLSNALVSRSSSSTTTAHSTGKEEYTSSFEKNVESSNISEMIENLVATQRQSAPKTQGSDSSIRTLIEDATIEDPPVEYREQAQELTSSTTRVTTTTTRTEIVHRRLSNETPAREEHDGTLNESRLISMLKLNDSDASFVPDNGEDHFNKSTSEIKSWERSLVERTRGQIAWLELQKINFKKHGNAEKVSAIKRQQRAILMRLEKERLRLKESKSREKMIANVDEDLVEKAMMKLDASVDFTGNDSETRENIERVLQQREQKISSRRRKIEHLMSWQRRLDDEERKLKSMERDLLSANQVKLSRSPSKKPSNDILNASFEMVKSINKSLKMLENVEVSHDNESVEVVGHKMNKLWFRLTGIVEEKFRPQELRRFTKRELAQFYEDAKETVLESDLKILLETSQQPPAADKNESQSDNEQVTTQENERKESGNDDTMESIANIETEEEFVEKEEEKEEEEEDEEEEEEEDEEELHQMLANQMKIFVDHKEKAVNDETFQVRRKSQEAANESSSTIVDEEAMEIVADEDDNFSSSIHTEKRDSVDFSSVAHDGSIIAETQPQVTDMDEDEKSEAPMIEDTSFPNLEISLNDTPATHEFEESRAHDLSTITECTEYEQMSSEPISSEIATHSSYSTSDRLNSEIEQRLLSLSDSLEQVDKVFKKIPVRSAAEGSSGTYSTDQDFIDSKMIQDFENAHFSNSDSEIAASTPKVAANFDES